MALQIAISQNISAYKNSGGGKTFQYLFDAISPLVPRAGFSLRKLSSTYSGACIRVRRDSDNTEQDIGFISRFLDTTALLSFVGSGSGFVTKVYDQTGNGRNRVQSTINRQPRIVLNGVVEKLNNMPTINFYSQSCVFQTETGQIIVPSNTDLSFSFVYTNTRVGASSVLLYGGTNQYAFASTSGSASSAFGNVNSGGNNYVNNAPKTIITRNDSYISLIKATSLIAQMASTFNVNTTWGNLCNFGGYGLIDPSFQYNGYYNEELWFDGNQDPSFTKIWTNQNNYYTFL